MKRREFITLLGGAAGWPLAARAQDATPARLVGVPMATAADEDQEAGLGAFLQALKQLGWVEGRNVRFDIRWAKPKPLKLADMRPNWRRSLQISFLRTGRLPCNLCCGKHVLFQSCSTTSPIRSALASSIVWRDRVGTPPGLFSSNTP